ncbi:MAG: metallophosphoesterase [archaeon]|jgi:hypothetical protein
MKKIETLNNNNKKNIFKDAEIFSLCLFLKKENALLIGDLHIGGEESLNASGLFIPRKNFEKVIKELGFVFSKTGKVKTVFLMGDVKHGFGLPNRQEFAEINLLFDFLAERSEKITIIKGNHDNYLEMIVIGAKTRLGREINVKKSEILGKRKEIFLIHGDEIKKAPKNVKLIIIGHEHCAITLRDFAKSEKFKCFIKTKICGTKVIAMPSLNFIATGTDLSTEEPLSPYLKEMKEFECWVVEDEKSFYFGKIKKIRTQNR